MASIESGFQLGKKNRDDYLESLEREVKDLKSVNRQLMRRLKKVDRNYKASEELTDKDKQDDDKQVQKEAKDRALRCPSCHEGRMLEIVVMNRCLRKCDKCEYRTKAQQIKEKE